MLGLSSCLAAFAFAAAVRVAHGSCAAEGQCPGGKADASADDDLGLLQHSRGQRKPREQAWAQLQAAVKVEELQAALEQAKRSEAGKQLQGQLQQQLSKLQQAFPGGGELKQRFSTEWGDISKAVDVESLQRQMDSAKGEEAEMLKEKLEALRSQLPEMSVVDIQKRAIDTWTTLQKQGVPLPNLDEIPAQTEALANEALVAAGQAIQSLAKALNSDTAHAAYHAAGQAGVHAVESLSDALTSDTAHAAYSAAGQAAGQAVGSVSDALNSDAAHAAYSAAGQAAGQAVGSLSGALQDALR